MLSWLWSPVGIGAAAGAVIVGGVVATPAILGAGTAGIAAGTWMAAVQGPAVVAGGWFAIVQSLGASGWFAAPMVAAAAAGGAGVGAAVGAALVPPAAAAATQATTNYCTIA